MASPPYAAQTPTALSPPFPSHTQLPPLNTMTNRKRSAADGSPAPSLKRRKASTMSAASGGASAHPLRQTSFPPDEVGTPMTARSPSVDIDNVSLVSGSQVSATAAQTKRKRGRKSKADRARELTPNTAAGGTAASSVSGPKSLAGAPGDTTLDEDDGDDELDSEMLNASRSEHDRKEEKRLRAMLADCMDADQFDRLSKWRAAKLPDPVIRRLVNSTVSQSVPANVVTAVRSVTKYIITDVIVKALRVQKEWAAAGDEKQADTQWAGMVLSRGEPEVQDMWEQQSKMTGKDVQDDESKLILKEEPMAPLRPDHVREAWRRYKVSAQDRGAGTLTLWSSQQHSGVERFPVRTGGKRLFK